MTASNRRSPLLRDLDCHVCQVWRTSRLEWRRSEVDCTSCRCRRRPCASEAQGEDVTQEGGAPDRESRSQAEEEEFGRKRPIARPRSNELPRRRRRISISPIPLFIFIYLAIICDHAVMFETLARPNHPIYSISPSSSHSSMVPLLYRTLNTIRLGFIIFLKLVHLVVVLLCLLLVADVLIYSSVLHHNICVVIV